MLILNPDMLSGLVSVEFDNFKGENPPNCISKGRYCSSSTDSATYFGKALVIEDLR